MKLMANQEQLTLLKQGIEAWNQWQKEYPKSRPDLSRSDLQGANLSEINLSGADLSSADLRNARLDRAQLNGANLNHADLSYATIHLADLSGTNLQYANLSYAKLNNSNLSGTILNNANMYNAELTGTQFHSADLSGTNLQNAMTYWTTFSNIDLRSVKGLESIKHEGPSNIATNTLERSEGDIPEIFLRGAGLSDTLITYTRSLVLSPIQYYTCFICYSSSEQDFAESLYADLQSNGVRCWFAPEDLKIGDHYHQRIDESIHLHDKLILILSDMSIQSSWVEREVVAAREKEDREQHPVLFPLRLDNAVMHTTKAWAADVRRRWHIGDFTQWKQHDVYQQAFGRLLRDLKAID